MCANKECNTCLPSDHGPEANVAHGQRMQSKMTVDRGGGGGGGRERTREGGRNRDRETVTETETVTERQPTSFKR